jgi:hypothetical protein
MQSMGDGACPFDFNMDPATFKVGDTVSYRVPDQFQDFPFVGVLLEVHDDYVILASDPDNPDERYRASRAPRPIVGPGQL